MDELPQPERFVTTPPAQAPQPQISSPPQRIPTINGEPYGYAEYGFYPPTLNNPHPDAATMNNFQGHSYFQSEMDPGFYMNTGEAAGHTFSSSESWNSQGYWGAPTVPDSDLHSPPSDFDPMNNLSQGNAAPSNFFFLGENFLQENMHDDSGFATSSFETVSQGLDNSVPFFPNFLPETEATPAFDGNNSGIWWNYNDLFDNLPHDNPSSSANGNTSKESFNRTLPQGWTRPISVNSGENDGNTGDQWYEGLVHMSTQELMQFKSLLEQALSLSKQATDIWRSHQLVRALVLVQRYIILRLNNNGGPTAGNGNMWGDNIANIHEPRSSTPTPNDNLLETMARMQTIFAGSKVTHCLWSGDIPPRIYNNPTFSCKVFLGGLPWDVSEFTLMEAFQTFGITSIEWHVKGGRSKEKNCAYAIFENEEQVKLLLQKCRVDYSLSFTGINYYFKVSSGNLRSKNVQVIPWAASDSNYTRSQLQVDPSRIVFVGGVHGKLNAEGLCKIMNDLFGNVIFTGIDLDKKWKYPMGSARVAFSTYESYLQAVLTGFIHVKSNLFDQKFQVNPYLYERECSVCQFQQAPYFCRDVACLNYFCRTCFHEKHSDPQLRVHYLKVLTTFKRQRHNSGGCRNGNRQGKPNPGTSSRRARHHGSSNSGSPLGNNLFHRRNSRHGNFNELGGGNSWRENGQRRSTQQNTPTISSDASYQNNVFESMGTFSDVCGSSDPV